MSIISAAFLGFSQDLLAILLPKEAGPNPKDLGVAIATGAMEKKLVEKGGALSHFCPQKTGTVVA